MLRVVRLYAQVLVENRCLAMRSAPMRILIHAPKDDQVWGIGHKAPEKFLPTTPACPDQTVYIEKRRVVLLQQAEEPEHVVVRLAHPGHQVRL